MSLPGAGPVRPAPAHQLVLSFGDAEIPVEVARQGDQILVRSGEAEAVLTAQVLSEHVYAVTLNDRQRLVHYAFDGAAHQIQIDGEVYIFRLVAPGGRPDPSGWGTDAGRVLPHHQDLGAPMPGLVTQVFVQEGESVAAGRPLFVVEAMKMENIVRAPAAGRVTRIRIAPGERVDAGVIVVEMEEG